MADTKVSALSALGSVDRASDLLYVVGASGPTSNKMTINAVLGITGDPVGHSDSQTLSNKTIGNSNVITARDDRFTIQDNSDATKQAVFQASGITAGNTRTYTLPDRSGTLVTLNGDQTFTGVITAPGAVLDQAVITRPTLQTDTISEYTAAAGITIDGLLIKDGLLPAGNIQPLNLVTGTGSTWVPQSWSPTFTNITVGNGTVVAKYIQTGKMVDIFMRFTLGPTSAVSSGPYFSLPVTASANYNFTLVERLFNVHIEDSGTSSFFGRAGFRSNTEMLIQVMNVGGTYASNSSITSTVPMTWTTGDSITVVGRYEAA